MNRNDTMPSTYNQITKHESASCVPAIKLTILRSLTLLTACSLLQMAACADEDAIVEPAFEAGSMEAIQAGYFEPFAAGDELVLYSAAQSGLWFMPALRYQGMAGVPEISCIVIDLDKDTILADREGHLRSRELDGWPTLTYNMAVILPHVTSQTNDLGTFEGDTILFECTALDEEDQVFSLSHEMHLAIR